MKNETLIQGSLLIRLYLHDFLNNYMKIPEELLSIPEKFGEPVFVYDTGIMQQHYHQLSDAFSAIQHFKINYACKANTNLNILRFFYELGAGLDAVSIQEVELGLLAGFPADKIIFTPNGVSFTEIEQAVKFGVHINIDNLSVLEHFGTEFPDYPVGIRINPHIMAGGHAKISVGHIDSKFGISIYQLPHILRVVNVTGLTINGLHMHTGSDILDIDVFLQGADILFDAAENFPKLEYIDFGSGFKVPYFKGDTQTDIKLLGKKLSKKFLEFQSKRKNEIQLMFEPGKYLVSEAGFFLSRVNVVKQTTSTVFAGINSGFNHLIRPMFYDAYHHITNLSHPKGRTRYYTVVGYICETDTFANNRAISEIREGDILCFHNAGAYCFSMASNYNSRFRPAEVWIKDGKTELIRRSETMDDLLSTTVKTF